MIRFLSLIAALVLGVAGASPATPTDSDSAVSVCVEIDTPVSEVQYGKPIVFRCIVAGTDRPYTIQWQKSEDKERWDDVPCNGDVYEVILDEANAGTFYRVVIHTE